MQGGEARPMIKRKVFRTFLASFLSVFVLPTILLVCVLSAMLGNIREETAVNDRLKLSEFLASVDARLYALQRGGDGLIVSEKIQYLSSVSNPLEYTTSTGYFTVLRSLMQEISTFAIGSEDIINAYVFFSDTDYVVASSYLSAQRYFSSNLRQRYMGYDEWKELLLSDAAGFVTYRDAQGDRQTSYIRRNAGSTAVMVIDIATNAFESGERDASTDYVIFGRNGLPLYSTGEMVWERLPDGAAGESGEGELNLQGKRVYSLWARSSATGCSYFTIKDYNLYISGYNSMLLLALAAVAVLLLGGVLLSYRLAKRQYKPIDELRSMVNAQNGAKPAGDDKRDDFSYLREMLGSMQDERVAIRSRLKAKNQDMEHYVLERLLSGNFASVKSIEEELLALDIAFSSDRFAVIALRIDSLPPPDSEGDSARLEEDRRLMRFVCHNVFEELFSGFDPHILETINREYILLSPGQESDWRTPITSLLSQGREVLSRNYELMISAAVSDCVEGMQNIRVAYTSVRDYLTRTEKGAVSLMWEVSASSDSAKGFLSQMDALSHKLLQLLAAGEQSALNAEMLKMTHLCAEHSFWAVRVALTSLLNDLMLEFGGKCSQEEMASVKRGVQLFLASPLSQTDASQVCTILTDALSLGQSAADNARAEDIAQSAKKYIERHYAASSMNVSLVAECLHLTPSYASAIYKRQTGESMLDTINKTRISHARVLLTTTRLSLDEIAEQVGYYNSSTLIRVFKKYEGVTPGQYRTLQSGSEA
ncbi:MAG: AraC family transcriptional regulator [Eubacteriales bacterium]|nr:AraC family transcriptional regulator [Eubacteriales bacterium]MDD3880637.1 AraC family transcriptional regulator [Eubacteriales bacterium]MDD4513543.1 AraC family transcriptional regulator [Eubacteriales bacterium]